MSKHPPNRHGSSPGSGRGKRSGSRSARGPHRQGAAVSRKHRGGSTTGRTLGRRSGADPGRARGISRPTRYPRLVVGDQTAAFLEAGHAWVVADRFTREPEGSRPGEVVSLVTRAGDWLGNALYCPGERVVARVLSRDPDIPCDTSLFRARAVEAFRLRDRLRIDATQYRLVHAEGDGLPGLTVDRYGDFLVLALFTAAAMPLVTPTVDALMKLGEFQGAFLKLLPRDRRKASLPGGRWIEGVPGPDEMVTREGDLQFLVRPFSGLSTGIFLDQRDNRTAVAKWTRGLRVLNAFAYTGGFSLACARAGAQVDTLDLSGPALEWAKENFRRNGLQVEPSRFIRADAFDHLEHTRGAYDAIILDPPTFSTSGSRVWSPSRTADLLESALRAVSRGGIVVAFTNAQSLREDRYHASIGQGILRSGRSVRVLSTLQAGPDFPWDVGTPETRHLKGVVLLAT